MIQAIYYSIRLKRCLLYSVRPDGGIKNLHNFPKSSLFSAYFNCDTFKIAKKSPDIWALFVKTFVVTNTFIKQPKMGHPQAYFQFIFGLFQTNITILQQINVKNVHAVTVLGYKPMTFRTQDYPNNLLTRAPARVSHCLTLNNIHFCLQICGQVDRREGGSSEKKNEEGG